MRYALKSTLVVCTALIVTALLAPAAAEAAELPEASATTTRTPTIAELTAEVTATAMAESRAANALAWIDARIAASRERLAVASNDRTGEAIAAEIASLTAERSDAAAVLAHARSDADEASAALEALFAEAAAVERAVRVAIYGVFPVAGEVEFVDSWGAPRSGGRTHKGTDIMAAAGTPVVAVKDGVVTSGNSSLGGITLWLETADGTRYYYAHLQSIEVGSGEVTAGQVIGYVGSTGNASASAPHLHFEIHRPEAVDPYAELLEMAR